MEMPHPRRKDIAAMQAVFEENNLKKSFGRKRYTTRFGSGLNVIIKTGTKTVNSARTYMVEGGSWPSKWVYVRLVVTDDYYETNTAEQLNTIITEINAILHEKPIYKDVSVRDLVKAIR
tara:strand:- start:165 stop:521 length:357 start_codon:yes stop_codon:yes gene_type:complete